MEKATEQNLRKVKDLKPADYNPRTITSQQLKRLKKALEEFGDLSGIILNIRTGNLVGGHQRVKIFKEYKDQSIIEIDRRYDPPTRTGTVAEGAIIIQGERYIYREVDWTVEKEKAANIAANAHGGEFDEEMLSEVLKDLAKETTLDIELTGFDLSDIYHLTGENPLIEQPERLVELSERLRSLTERKEEMDKEIKEREDTHFYLVIVFANHDERKKFTDALNLPDNRYQDGRTLLSLLKEKNS